jgi:hypothetical protein
MKTYRVIFTLGGKRLETIIRAQSQLLAIAIVKGQFAGTDVHDINAVEVNQ